MFFGSESSARESDPEKQSVNTRILLNLQISLCCSFATKIYLHNFLWKYWIFL